MSWTGEDTARKDSAELADPSLNMHYFQGQITRGTSDQLDSLGRRRCDVPDRKKIPATLFYSADEVERKNPNRAQVNQSADGSHRSKVGRKNTGANYTNVTSNKFRRTY